MACIRLVVALFGFASAIAQGPAEPAFATGDLATLDCRLVAVQAREDGVQHLTVEVHNKGTVAAEPLAFRIELPQKKPQPPAVATFVRAQLPHAARHGRPAPAGGKQTYVLSTRLPGKKGQLSVYVTAATFGSDLAVPKPAIAFGKPEQVQRESMAGTFPVTKVAVTNALPREVDVLVLVTYEQPKDVIELVGLRLPAQGTRDVVIATRPGNEVFLDPLMEMPGCAIKAVAFEVVDWCLVGAVPKDAGVALLREAYEGWYRWPEAEPTVAGDFTFRERSRRAVGEDGFQDFVVKGRFTLAPDGKVQIQMVEGKGANASFLLRDALANVRRPDFALLAQRNRLVQVAADRIALVGPGWHLTTNDSGAHTIDGTAKAEESPDLEVRDGRIVSDGRGTHERSRWETRELDGVVVVTRRWSQTDDSRYTYAKVDGRIVPTAATNVRTIGGKLFAASEIEITNLAFTGVPPIAPPAPEGDGVQVLRAMWDAAYRLPVAPLEIRAKFEVLTGNDGMWRGRKKLTGTIGMRGIGRSLRSSDCAFDGKLAREDEVQLAAVLRDRFLLWYGADFNDRPPFDEFFRGAVIHAPDGEGVFAVERCRCDRVFTSGGLVRGFRGTGGASRTKFTWGKVGDRDVVVRVDIEHGGDDTPAAQRWSAATILTMAKVGEHVLPAKIVFERAFGRDWAPETITFRDLQVRE